MDGKELEERRRKKGKGADNIEIRHSKERGR